MSGILLKVMLSFVLVLLMLVLILFLGFAVMLKLVVSGGDVDAYNCRQLVCFA